MEKLRHSVQLMLHSLRQERDHTYRVWFFCCSLVPFLAEREGIRPRELYGIAYQCHIIPELHAIASNRCKANPSKAVKFIRV